MVAAEGQACSRFSWSLPGTAPTVSILPVGLDTYGGFMADPITFDRDLDFRSDAVYVGRTIDPCRRRRLSARVLVGKVLSSDDGHLRFSLPARLPHGASVGTNRIPTEMVSRLPIGRQRLILLVR